jgi:hypothetical protein
MARRVLDLISVDSEPVKHGKSIEGMANVECIAIVK